VTVSERSLIEEVRRGNPNAFGRLVECHQARLFGLVLMMVRRPAAAEDVTQDTFVRAFTHLDQYDLTRPFYPWLAAIAVRRAQNWLRANGRGPAREGTSIDDAPEPLAQTDEALPALIATEERDTLWRAVEALASGERAAVLLYYRDELAVKDIALALGVAPGTVKTLLFRARRRLRMALTARQPTGQDPRP
jgi:RNA polymerase sigma-70 factor (ECF subfamily)